MVAPAALGTDSSATAPRPNCDRQGAGTKPHFPPNPPRQRRLRWSDATVKADPWRSWQRLSFKARVERLFDLAEAIEKIFSSSRLEHRIAGGLAAYLYVEEADPEAGRLTKDIDIAVPREDLERIAKAAQPFGLQHRHVAGSTAGPDREPVRQTRSPPRLRGREGPVGVSGTGACAGDLSNSQGAGAHAAGGPGSHEADELSGRGRSSSQGPGRGRTHHAGNGSPSLADPRPATGAGPRARTASYAYANEALSGCLAGTNCSGLHRAAGGASGCHVLGYGLLTVRTPIPVPPDSPAAAPRPSDRGPRSGKSNGLRPNGARCDGQP